MIDCGVSYNKIKNKLYDIDYLLITHIHGDHLKETTYNRIRKNFPNIATVSHWQVSQKLSGDIDFVIDIGESMEIGEYNFETFEGIHDVVVCGYSFTVNDKDVIYITDSQDFSNAPDKEYDYLFLESNHDEDKLNAIKRNSRKKYRYDAYGNGMRHCSTQRCKAFYYSHRKEKESELIELHKSQRFY